MSLVSLFYVLGYHQQEFFDSLSRTARLCESYFSFATKSDNELW